MHGLGLDLKFWILGLSYPYPSLTKRKIHVQEWKYNVLFLNFIFIGALCHLCMARNHKFDYIWTFWDSHTPIDSITMQGFTYIGAFCCPYWARNSQIWNIWRFSPVLYCAVLCNVYDCCTQQYVHTWTVLKCACWFRLRFRFCVFV